MIEVIDDVEFACEKSGAFPGFLRARGRSNGRGGMQKGRTPLGGDGRGSRAKNPEKDAVFSGAYSNLKSSKPGKECFNCRSKCCEC